MSPLIGQLLVSGAEYELGDLFDVEGNRDLEFRFSLVGDNAMDGVVVYQLTGDYNDDGVVDAADYTVWRDAVGSTTASRESRPVQLGRDRCRRLRGLESELRQPR